MLMSTIGPDRVGDHGKLTDAASLPTRFSSPLGDYEDKEIAWMLAGLRTFKTQFVIQASMSTGVPVRYDETQEIELATELATVAGRWQC